MTPFLSALFVLSAASAEPTATPPQAAPPARDRTIEIVIAGPEDGRGKLEETIRPLLGDAKDLRWSAKERLPVEEALPAPRPDGGVQIWIDLANPIQLRVYLPAQTVGGATTIRTVARPEGEDAELVVRETVAQIVKAAVQALRGDAALAPAEAPRSSPETVAEVSSPPAGANLAARPASEPRRPGRFGFVLAGGAHTSPLNLGEPAGQDRWLGPSVVAQARWHLDKYMLALRMSWETSERSVDMYYLKNTYFTGTVAASRFIDAGIASFGLGLEAGLLVLHQNTWLDGAWQAANGYSRVTSLPGQTGQTNSAGGLVGPVVEFNLVPTPSFFLHFDMGIPIAVLYTKDEFGSRWEGSPYFRATVGVGFRL